LNRRFAAAVLAFLALPGSIAFLVPLVLFAGRDGSGFVDPLGAIPLALGTALLLWCVREFYVVGRGTLAPWSPPEAIVTTGPYRLSRNPMYVAVLLILVGWTLAFRSGSLAVYTLVMAAAFHVRVLTYEEPWLDRTFGPAWLAYKARVPRWLPSSRRARPARPR
jgi:protein-S-isoprenylcysteine O-methyltransferase Ste14